MIMGKFAGINILDWQHWVCVKSLAPGRCGIDFKCVIFKCFVRITFMAVCSAIAFRWTAQDPNDDK